KNKLNCLKSKKLLVIKRLSLLPRKKFIMKNTTPNTEVNENLFTCVLSELYRYNVNNGLTLSNIFECCCKSKGIIVDIETTTINQVNLYGLATIFSIYKMMNKMAE
uniref:hypothetical protein n=1 Tax=Escherichia sp. MOD1-EC7003 TaxID=2093900 RepID=UPI001F53EB56